MRHLHRLRFRPTLALLAALMLTAYTTAPAPADDAGDVEQSMRRQLDAPLLFVKRHSYTGIHIYDTFYKWPPGGGGIYVLENPAAPRDQWRIRTVIDEHTPGPLGHGVYTHPNLSWDGTRLLFCFKGEPEGDTSIYEIGVDGSNLRRLTDPGPANDLYHGHGGGQHDVAPAYLPDGRIVFLSTRPSGLVPCNNTGVAILHVMNADGSDIHPISVNNVNEFDPAVLPDGRILFGRWEYIDKNALTIQSLWTINPDGTQETAFYANNMVFPEAILDARPVPGSHLIVGTFAKHNATPRGSIALVDPRMGKNNPGAITNLEHPDDPTFDRGNSCEPWPVSEDLFLFSGRPEGAERNAIEMLDRSGNRALLMADPDICLHSPMLIKPRPRPRVIAATADRRATTGRFFVQDIYQGLDGVRRGDVKQLRVLEETSRVSASGMGGSPFNQVFLISAALAWSPKNFLGVVPVGEDGSAYFEVPAGRAVYLQALDAEGRLVQSMRTFVQAAPGTTRSCVGCHEHKSSTTVDSAGFPAILGREPDQLQPERWGSGYIDYPSMVQPILDRHCVRCHGGAEDIAGGMDLSGGWTEFFNISYENLVSRRETQLVAHWIAGIDCMNGTAFWSSQIFPPRGHGSGAAPLADRLVERHDLPRAERDLLMAWIDTNGLYHGTWDYTPSGAAIPHWKSTVAMLTAEMQAAGCMECHGEGNRPAFFESDWINLRTPEHSRILRAPLAEGGEGFGLGWCRDRKVDPRRQRIHLLRPHYYHAVQPVEAFERHEIVPPDRSGEPVASFASTESPHYQNMLRIIREAQHQALAAPRIDMPGAVAVPGACRLFVPPPLPDAPPKLTAEPDRDGLVHLAWEQSAWTIGLEAEVHRGGRAEFVPGEDTFLARSSRPLWIDSDAPEGTQFYALVLVSGENRSRPGYTRVDVPRPAVPPAPPAIEAEPASHSVRLRWGIPDAIVAGYHVYRREAPDAEPRRLTEQPVTGTTFADAPLQPEVPYTYHVRAVSARGVESGPSPEVTAAAIVLPGPVFTARFDGTPTGVVHDGSPVAGRRHGPAKGTETVLDVREGGFATFPHRGMFDLPQPLTVSCWVWFEKQGTMPVVVGCGHWNQAGWFLQWLGGRWRWHVGGLDCDGGTPEPGRWMHVAGTFDGQTARLFQDGKLVAERAGPVNTTAWQGDLHVGQYSGGPRPEFQVTGRIANVTVHHRPLPAEEVVELAKQAPE
ncbi:MAG: LamG-like jellyroll fold domain-containing protein [Thermoguttaceae bacterium]|jgi:mono/diheme cytochrome c family protein|nr:LamG-like jellyroll fold domain-containing protein [Thermoguttaceae bacterium]